MIKLPDEYHAHYSRVRTTIASRLAEFRAVPRSEYLWELCFCILTPQSRAAHAEEVIRELREKNFLEHPFDPTNHLRNPAHYIRFHNQKAKRLLAIADNQQHIISVLNRPELTSHDKRLWLVTHVNGLGWKEASHFLRNIGCDDLAIIDRHILKHLLRCNAIEAIPETITRKHYLELETIFISLAGSFGLSLQELDLLFWSLEEGTVRK